MLTTGADRLVTVDKTSPWYAGHGADPPALVGEENYGEQQTTEFCHNYSSFARMQVHLPMFASQWTASSSAE